MILKILKLCLENVLHHSDERVLQIMELEYSAKIQRVRDSCGEIKRCCEYLRIFREEAYDKSLLDLLKQVLDYSFGFVFDLQYASLILEILQIFEKHNIDYVVDDLTQYQCQPRVCAMLILLAGRHERVISCIDLLAYLYEKDHLNLRLVINSLFWMKIEDEELIKLLITIILDYNYIPELAHMFQYLPFFGCLFEQALVTFQDRGHTCWKHSIQYLRYNCQFRKPQIQKAILLHTSLSLDLIQLIHQIMDVDFGRKLVEKLQVYKVNEFYFDLLTILLLNDIKEVNYVQVVKDIPNSYFDLDDAYSQESLIIFIETAIQLEVEEMKEVVESHLKAHLERWAEKNESYWRICDLFIKQS